MRTRRGSLLWGTMQGSAILMYKPGDVVKPVTVMDQFFTGEVRAVDLKTNKVTVAWGGGPESQHDADEIMPMPFFGAAHTNGGTKVASTRRMRADVDDLLDVPEIGEDVVDSEEESVEQTDFLADDMEGLLNRQVGNEFYSAYLYYMVAAICQSKGLVGFQKWFEGQGDDEIDHAMKVYKYLMDTGSTVELPAIPGPALSSDMEVAELTRAVLDHEMGVTQDWKRIGQLAKEQDNPATCQLVQWFMTEQVEEEDAALTLHQRVQLADTGSGILLIDNDLKDRGPTSVTAADMGQYKKALEDAREMMGDQDLEPTSALKQAASDNGIPYGPEMSRFVAWANRQLGFKATNPPMGQYCGRPGTHGLDSPRGGGFSVMKDLAYDLHDEANEFADVNPRLAAIKAGLKEIAWDADSKTCAECEASIFIRQATSGDEPPAQRTVEEETAKKSAVSAQASMGNGTPTKAQQRTIDRLERAGFRQVSDFAVAGEFTVVMQKRRGPTTYSGEVEEDGTVNGMNVEGFLVSNVYLSQRASVDCGALKLDGLKSRRAMYWCAPDRTFRLTKQEQDSGSAVCPKCKAEMQVEPFTRSDKLMICPECRFKVPTSKAVTKVEVKVPAGVEVDVTTKGEDGEEVQGEAIMAANSLRYKGYTIEKSGANFYVKDPSGHRAFGEVPASVETAKKWIDMDISNNKKASEGVKVSDDRNLIAGVSCRRGRMAYADPSDLADLPRMSLSQIASLVYQDWKNVNFAAKPYLEAMSSLQNVSDMYFQDTGTSIVAYFLSNATSWRGDVAKAVKKELQRRIRR